MIKKIDSISGILIASVVVAILLFMLIIPYTEFTHLIIDEETKKIIFKRERFLLKKKEKQYDIKTFFYTYKDEYRGLPSKEKVFTVYENGSKQITIRATGIGYKLLDNFVLEIEKVKNKLSSK